MSTYGKKLMASLFIIIACVLGFIGHAAFLAPEKTEAEVNYDATLYFPLDRYPETGDHIRDAIAAGHSSVCTIDREGAEANREESLKGYPTKTGYDRDEWPMAMCEEGGAGADIRYISPSDNRGAGSWVGNQLEQYPDGTRVQFIVQ